MFFKSQKVDKLDNMKSEIQSQTAESLPPAAARDEKWNILVLINMVLVKMFCSVKADSVTEVCGLWYLF